MTTHDVERRVYRGRLYVPVENPSLFIGQGRSRAGDELALDGAVPVCRRGCKPPEGFKLGLPGPSTSHFEALGIAPECGVCGLGLPPVGSREADSMQPQGKLNGFSRDTVPCKTPGCAMFAAVGKRGYCHKCSRRVQRHGTAEKPGKRVFNDDLGRFLSHVSKKGHGGCWMWTAATDGKGYGRSFLNGGNIPAHRLSFYLHNGYLPEGLVRHTCDNPGCVNPSHLVEGTAKENAEDMDERGRRPRGSARVSSNRRNAPKLDEAKVSEMRKAAAAGRNCAELALEYGVSPSVALKAVRGKTWKHVEQAPVKGLGKGQYER